MLALRTVTNKDWCVSVGTTDEQRGKNTDEINAIFTLQKQSSKGLL